MSRDYAVRTDQVIVLRVMAWDANCLAHIPQRFDTDEVRALVAARDARIAELEREVRMLRAQIAPAR